MWLNERTFKNRSQLEIEATLFALVQEAKEDFEENKVLMSIGAKHPDKAELNINYANFNILLEELEHIRGKVDTLNPVKKEHLYFNLNTLGITYQISSVGFIKIKDVHEFFNNLPAVKDISCLNDEKEIQICFEFPNIYERKKV